MSKPLIAIVGRPNVGKSMLFNKIIGRRLSIVEDTPGVTRDRIYGESDWNGRKFTLVDTGGIEPNTDNQILAFMRQQAQIAIDNATVIVLVTDIKTGMTAADQEVAGMLQRSKKPIVLAVNKMDSTGPADPEFYEFYNLGLGDPIAVSAVHGHGTGDLLVLVCAICFSVHILVIDHFTATCDGVKLSCLQFLFAGTWSTILALFFDTISLQVLLDCIWPLLYVGVFSCGVGYTLQILAQKGSNPTVVTILLSLESVFAVIAGAVVLHQQMTAREYQGCVLMFAAEVLAQIPMPQKKEAKAE